MNSSMYRNLTITALLMALAIMIPIMMPLKVVIPPASYTLASHVPIFLAMFLSRKMAACVVIGSTLGFFVAGFPIVIVMRAASHIIFALMGAYYIKHHPGVLTGALNIDLIYVVFVLVGGGTIIHSMVDGYIALYIYKAIPGLSKPENK
ncbi:MAG: hypothetical protein KH063_09725 [Veillonella sp.]|nr:hypothetical protein [Veillonella sp.]